jgi:hypothetical protein
MDLSLNSPFDLVFFCMYVCVCVYLEHSHSSGLYRSISSTKDIPPIRLQSEDNVVLNEKTPLVHKKHVSFLLFFFSFLLLG